MSNDDLAAEHGALVSAARSLVAHLATARQHLVYGEIAHHQHDQFAERVWTLHTYLDGALALAARDL